MNFRIIEKALTFSLYLVEMITKFLGVVIDFSKICIPYNAQEYGIGSGHYIPTYGLNTEPGVHKMIPRALAILQPNGCMFVSVHATILQPPVIKVLKLMI